MNPSTLEKLYLATTPMTETHILEIGARSGCWPQTVYKACARGYLYRTRPGWFLPTTRLERAYEEVRRIRDS